METNKRNQTVTAWICSICGYIHYGSEPPDECPVCGAFKEEFEAYIETAPVQAAAVSAVPARILVAGGGIAGVSAAEAARKAAPQAEIVLISSEAELPYYRMNLTRYLAGEVSAAELTLHPESWYAENGIQLLREAELTRLDLEKKEAHLSDEGLIAFDRAVLTTGSRPFVPPFPGTQRQNVTTLRTLRDADFILATGLQKGTCLCIGGGLLGLETAGALARQGIEVSVLEHQDRLLPRQLNPAASRLFQHQVQAMGVAVHTRAHTIELTGDKAVQGVELEGGACLPAGLVVISAGIRSNLDLARQGGLETRQGILVDNHLRTSHPDVYSAGDAVEHQGIVYGTWAPSQIQGSAAGRNAAGQLVEFNGLPRSATLKVLGVNMFSIGKISPEDRSEIMIEAEKDGKYACFVFHDQQMVGSILLGDTTLATRTKRVIEERQDCTNLLRLNPGVEEIAAFLAERIVD